MIYKVILVAIVMLRVQLWIGQSTEQLVINSNRYNAGAVSKGDIVERTFYLKNPTKDTVRVLAIEKTCRCSLFEIDSYTIAPQDSTGVKMQVDTKDKTGHFGVNSIIIADTPQKYYKVQIFGLVE